MLRSDLVRRVSLQNQHLYLRDVEKIIDSIRSCPRGRFVDDYRPGLPGDRPHNG
jgi:hypothetical protein